MSIEKRIRFCSYDVLYNKTHKPSSVFKYFQQIAKEDMDAVGLTYEALLEKGLVFVLAKMKSKFYKPIFSYDDITIKTSHRRVKGVSFIRDYIIIRNGELIGETSSYWVLMDINTRRLARPAVLDGLMNNPVELCSFEIDDRIAFEADGNEVFDYEYTVVLSDIDENGHMNNTRYPDICLDAISDISANHFISDIRIDYISESLKSHKLKINHFYSEDNSGYLFSAYNSTVDKNCFSAKIIFTEI